MKASEILTHGKNKIKLNKTFKSIIADLKRNAFKRMIEYNAGKKFGFILENKKMFEELGYIVIEKGQWKDDANLHRFRFCDFLINKIEIAW